MCFPHWINVLKLKIGLFCTAISKRYFLGLLHAFIGEVNRCEGRYKNTDLSSCEVGLLVGFILLVWLGSE